jgi:hypothetical protein
MSQPDFDAITTRLRASHGLDNLAAGDIGGTIQELPVRVQPGRGRGHAVEVTVEVASHQASRVRRALEERVVGLPLEVSLDIGGNGPAIRAGIIDPESMLDPLALVGAIEAVVNAVSLAADDPNSVSTGRALRHPLNFSSAVSTT